LIAAGAFGGVIRADDRPTAPVANAHFGGAAGTHATGVADKSAPPDGDDDTRTSRMRMLMRLLPYSGSRPFGGLK
jgi:hypothetical protein